MKILTTRNQKFIALIVGGLLAYASTRSLLAGAETKPEIYNPLILVGMALIYVVFAIFDRRKSAFRIELFGLVIFGLIAAVSTLWFPLALGVGLVLHGVWDIAQHPKAINTKVPTWYPPLCAIYDFLLAGVFFAYATTITAA